MLEATLDPRTAVPEEDEHHDDRDFLLSELTEPDVAPEVQTSRAAAQPPENPLLDENAWPKLDLLDPE